MPLAHRTRGSTGHVAVEVEEKSGRVHNLGKKAADSALNILYEVEIVIPLDQPGEEFDPASANTINWGLLVRQERSSNSRLLNNRAAPPECERKLAEILFVVFRRGQTGSGIGKPPRASGSPRIKLSCQSACFAAAF